MPRRETLALAGGAATGGFSASSYAAQSAVAQVRGSAGSVVANTAPPAPEPPPAPSSDPPTPRPPEPSPASRSRMTVFIQYPEGAQARADALRARIDRDLAPAYAAPGVEKVRQAPGRDQIRIYRDADEDRARELARATGLEGVQIVNLSRSYPNLPAGRMEVWLKAP